MLQPNNENVPAHRMDSSTELEFAGHPDRLVLGRQLAAIAVMGSLRGLHEDASIASAVAEECDPGGARHRLHCMIAHAIAGDASYAEQAMAQALERGVEDDMCKVVMATAMLLTGHPDGAFTLENVLATSIDQAARAAALGIRDVVPLLRRHAKKQAAGARFRPA